MHLDIKKMFRILIIVSVLFFIGASVYASDDQFVTMELRPSQEGITEFRYQIGGDDEALWERVEAADPTVVTIGPVDPAQPFVLYVQQSPDGKHWGGSVVTMYNPADGKMTFVRYTPPAPYTTQPLDEMSFGIEFFGGFGIKLTPFTSIESTVIPALTLDFVFDNLVQVGGNSSLGLRLGTAFETNTTTPNENSIYFHDIHLIPKYNLRLGSYAAADIGLGLSTVFMNYMSKGADDFLRDGDNEVVNFMLGPTFQFNLRFNPTPVLSAGLQYEGRLSFVDYFDSFELASFFRAGVGVRL